MKYLIRIRPLSNVYKTKIDIEILGNERFSDVYVEFREYSFYGIILAIGENIKWENVTYIHYTTEEFNKLHLQTKLDVNTVYKSIKKYIDSAKKCSFYQEYYKAIK